MSQIELKGVTAHYGSSLAIRGVDLTVGQGECLALLGPSGCGKTTTLNLIAGFAEPSAGNVFINGKSMAGVPPHKRNAAMVFQSYALFPHLSVSENVAFGLQMRKADRHTIAEKVRKSLDLVRLTAFGDRYPKQLSGGQQQRVALARALAVEPAVLLLDEPLSNLDARLREDMRVELAEIQRRVSITTVFVTHDQADAIAIADRIAVMKDGRLEQIGAASEIYQRPGTPFVASFVGRANFLTAVLVGAENGGSELTLSDGSRVRCAQRTDIPLGQSVKLFVRPERLDIDGQIATGANRVTATVERLMYLGNSVEVSLSVAGHPLKVSAPVAHAILQVGSQVHVSWDPAHCLIFALEQHEEVIQ